MGYEVVDEVVGPLLERRWLDPIQNSPDPVRDLKAAFRKYVEEDIASGSYVQGCPLNNLAQEMSPLDNGFRARIDGLYGRWRASIADALRQGMKAGSVRSTGGGEPDGDLGYGKEFANSLKRW